MRGPASLNVPGEVIAIPEQLSDVVYQEVDIQRIRASYLRGQLSRLGIENETEFTDDEVTYLAAETRLSAEECLRLLATCRT